MDSQPIANSVFSVVPDLALNQPPGGGSLNERQKQNESATPSENQSKSKYETPEIKIMTEPEVLSAFQVTAAGTHMWWG